MQERVMSSFREMRRKEKLMSEIDAYDILDKTLYMTLSTVLENGYPYALPLNHVLFDGRVYFHCAMEGQKNDSFRRDDRVCLSAVEQCEIVPDKFSTNFRSVTAFGRISAVLDAGEKRAALKELIRKFSPGFIESGDAYIEKLFERTAVYCVVIEHISGKMSRK
jgi:uncharacterized protein